MPFRDKNYTQVRHQNGVPAPFWAGLDLPAGAHRVKRVGESLAEKLEVFGGVRAAGAASRNPGRSEEPRSSLFQGTWWAVQGSNLRPRACKARALTS